MQGLELEPGFRQKVLGVIDVRVSDRLVFFITMSKQQMLTARLTLRAGSSFSRDPKILGYIQFGVRMRVSQNQSFDGCSLTVGAGR